MHFERKELTDQELLAIYERLLLPRLVEEKMLLLLRQGKISKWFSGIGQEAISVGATYVLHPEEWMMPLHRNLGVFTGRNMPLNRLFSQWQGHPDGYSRGRERSFHFGAAAHHICGMISHLGPQLTLANGAALAHKLRKEQKIALAFTGEGGTSEGDFHEALNVAAVWDLPVIFIIENNGYGLSTPTREQYRCQQLSQRAIGYGMEGVTIDGNNILSVIDTLQGVRQYCLEQQKPYLVECITFRMRGHEEASGTKYVPPELFEHWKQKDPIEQYEQFLLDEGILWPEKVAETRKKMIAHIQAEWEIAEKPAASTFSISQELNDVFSPATASEIPDATETILEKDEPSPETSRKLRFIDAIREGLQQGMRLNPSLILMGQDIAEYGGAFKITEGFVEEFGRARVRNTPICESAIVGAAIGLALEKIPSVVEMQFADFVSVAFNQIVNNLAKMHYRWGQNIPVVIRMPTGAGVGAGPFHSQSTEAWFVHTPGLKIVYPSSAYDAKGLLMAAIDDPNPVLFFEHKALYRSISGQVPETAYRVPIGEAKLVAEGAACSIICYGAAVHWAVEFQQKNPEISLDILDLRSLAPLDYQSVRKTVKKTGKVLILHEDTLTGGIGGEIAAWIAENCFEWLDAPVMRIASLDTPVPFNLELEKQFLAQSRLKEGLEKLIAW